MQSVWQFIKWLQRYSCVLYEIFSLQRFDGKMVNACMQSALDMFGRARVHTGTVQFGMCTYVVCTYACPAARRLATSQHHSSYNDPYCVRTHINLGSVHVAIRVCFGLLLNFFHWDIILWWKNSGIWFLLSGTWIFNVSANWAGKKKYFCRGLLMLSTSRSHALFTGSSSSLLNTWPIHLKLLLFTTSTTVYSKPNLSMSSLVFFLSDILTPHIFRVMALSVLLKIPSSTLFTFHVSEPYTIAVLTQALYRSCFLLSS